MSSMSDIHFNLHDMKKPVRKKSIGKDSVPYYNMPHVNHHEPHYHDPHPHDPHMHPEHSELPHDDVGRTDSLATLITDAMSNTGMQGLPNVQRSRNRFRRFFWTSICFAGIVVMSWQISLAVIKYYSYPTSTTLEYEYKTNLPFPAVTICNHNSVRFSALTASTSSELVSYMEQTHSGWNNEFLFNDTGSNNSSAPTFENWYSDTSSDYDSGTGDTSESNADSGTGTDYDYNYADDVNYQGTEDSGFNFVENFIAITSKLSRKERQKLGHQLSDMIISCTWQGKKCRTRQFASFNNYMYGNCYTFNSGRMFNNTKPKILKTDKIGPLYGLSLELFIEQEEYITGLADGAGIRLMIHNQTSMPFPEDYGISLQPGSKTSIGIARKDIYRVSAPHGSCVEYSWKDNMDRNAFLDDIETVNYTENACRKTCYQRALLLDCSCYDYKVPVNVDITAYQDIVQKRNITSFVACNEESVQQSKESCVRNVTTAFVNNQLACTSRCHAPCFEVEYPYTVSYSQWPSISSQGRVLNELSMKNEDFYNLVHSTTDDDANKKQWMNDNFLKVEVYFKDLNYDVIKIAASYDAINLISDLGGQAGLWLGVSVIAFFELFELLLDITILIVKYCSRKRAPITDKPKSEDTDRPPSKLAFGPSDPVPMKTFTHSSPELEAKIAVDDL